MKAVHAVLAASLFLVLPMASAASMDLVSLQDSPLEKGESVTLELRASGEDIAGYSARIVFNGTRLNYLNASGTASFPDPVVNSQSDSIIFTASKATGTNDPVLARLVFEVAGDGQAHAALNITRASLNTPSRGIEQVEFSGTLVEIQAEPGKGSPAENQQEGENNSTGPSGNILDRVIGLLSNLFGF
ncbi:MAG: hypothetical protein ABEJ75_03795 [Candidatus Nanohaloarchaea archaeon]